MILSRRLFAAPRLWFCLILLSVLAACSGQPSNGDQAGERLRVVATTSLIGDVAQVIGGDAITLETLIKAGADPHSFEPTAQQTVAIHDADVVFSNGYDLEESLLGLFESAVADGRRVVPVSAGIETIELAAGEEGGVDPHVWTSPLNVIVWARNVAATLAELDPAQAALFQANAGAYIAQLQELDAWIAGQVEHIPVGERKIVTDHAVFGYFTRRYGFQQVGAVVQGYSTLAEPSAQDLAALEDDIRRLGVRAVFVGNTVNPTLGQRVADDTGVRLLRVYTGSLSAPGGPAATYLDYMRYNVGVFVQGLRD